MARLRAGDEATFEQAETARNRAVTFFRNIGNDEQAGLFDSMSTEDYIEHKGLVLVNPAPALRNPQSTKRSTKDMATATLPEDLQDLTKPEIAEEVIDAESTLDDIWAETLLTEREDYDQMSDEQKIEALEDALENIADACNSYDEERFPIDAPGSDQSDGAQS